MNELIEDDVNGLLVAGEVTGKHRHVPLFEVDSAALGRAMVKLTDPGAVDALKSKTNAKILARREEFRMGLGSVLARVTGKPARKS